MITNEQKQISFIATLLNLDKEVIKTSFNTEMIDNIIQANKDEYNKYSSKIETELLISDLVSKLNLDVTERYILSFDKVWQLKTAKSKSNTPSNNKSFIDGAFPFKYNGKDYTINIANNKFAVYDAEVQVCEYTSATAAAESLRLYYLLTEKGSKDVGEVSENLFIANEDARKKLSLSGIKFFERLAV